ncbi:hypothetical protein BKA64DRAFT_725801 [Cadophora sp. MPI-SDFR-AT-0126]|nr:hypothetical protein BKA64DRAFT_725801 [Leotiomycetes sp. MPI-SDFR-AT-0126]
MVAVLNSTVASSMSSSSTPSEKCSSPVLSVKSFFASLGICIAAFLLIYAILYLLAYIEDRRKPVKTPRQEYSSKFAGAVMAMKRTIVFGERLPSVFIELKGLPRPGNDTRPIGPKDHFAYMLHYIDGVGLDGSFDFKASGEQGKYYPELVDVIFGTDVSDDGKSTSPNSVTLASRGKWQTF